MITLLGTGEEVIASAALTQCTIVPALAKTHRSIVLPGGAKLETDDRQTIAALERITKSNQGMRWVDILENHWRWISIITAMLLACLAGITYYGIPAAARGAADLVPPQLMEILSTQTLEQIDAHFLETSGLTAKRRSDLQGLLSMLTTDFSPAFTYRLEFRQGGGLGANALALPSGAIVITDELVALARDDKEIAAVLAHEMAHVEKRHALRSILQDAGVFLLISILVGDVTSITSIAASLPTLLVKSGYSRRFENEADEAAGYWLIHKGWGTRPLQDILRRIAIHQKGLPGPTWLSTHPDTDRRIKHLQALEQTPAAKKPFTPW